MFSEQSASTVAVILGMSVVTYLTKAGGLFVVNRIELSETTRAGMETLPGGVIVAVVAPSLLRGGPPEWVAGALVVAVVVRTDSTLLAFLVGVATVGALRGGLPGG